MITLNYLIYIYSHTYGYRSNSTNITKLTKENIYKIEKISNSVTILTPKFLKY